MAKACMELQFPTAGILPKAETGAAKFVEDHAQWDGRGVKVCIFDTGVDPGAAGLQVTSDGKPKIVDIIDCTGDGDVDTSTVVEVAENDTTLKGATGRTLTLPDGVKCPTRKFRTGLKRIFELFPKPLLRRVQEERKQSFMEEQQRAVSAAQRALADFNAAHASPNDAEKRQKKDLEHALEALKEAADAYADPGPVFDCLVYHDGERWVGAVDTTATGDFRRAKFMTNFRAGREWGTISGVAGTREHSVLLNYCLNVYEDGERLSIVTDCGSHGTHVAGIVAACFPDDPALNGVAPGAQLVSCKIGDARLGSMETGTAVVRALIAAKQTGCDLINMSFGESYIHSSGGRFEQLAAEFVERHGIVFVSSAGNNGPCLSTVGAPGGTNAAIISVGAYVSPGMMEVQYSLSEQLPATNYTWSSRGPTPDGRAGVQICAPGGAIAPVPTWTLQGKQLMNGTSMSSPNCCGGLALVLSAAKAQGTPYTAAAVRRAIENTASPVEQIEPWALGAGLLNVPRAHEYLSRFTGKAELLGVAATLPARGGARGLYLRNASEVESKMALQVACVPQFHADCDNRDKVSDGRGSPSQVDFEMNVALETTAQWARVPGAMVLNASGKGFELTVDPTGLPEGCHFAEVLGRDAKKAERGPVLRLPITVIVPRKVPAGDWRLPVVGRTYLPGALDRHFIDVPAGATWASVSFRTKELEGAHMLVVHALQVLPGVPCTGHNRCEFEKYLRLKPNTEVVEKISCVGGLTLEICICKWWASLGAAAVDIEVTFHGLPTSASAICVSSGAPAQLEFGAPLRAETSAVSCKLTHLQKTFRPTSNVLRPLSEDRDLLPRGRQIYELLLTYSFEQSEKETVKVSPKTPFAQLLYDSPFESQLWMVFDSNQQLMGAGDALYDYTLSLPKGKYTVKLQELAPGVYPSLQAALAAGDKYTGAPMAKGARQTLFVTAPTDKAPGAKPGDLLTGVLKVGGEDKCAVSVVVPKEEESEEDKKDKADDGKTDKEREAEEVRDARVKFLKKLCEDKKLPAFDALATELAAAHPDHLPLLREVLARHDVDGEAGEAEPDRRERCVKALKAAAAVVSAVDAGALAAHFGLKHDTAGDAALKAKCKEMDERKAALIDALLARVERVAELLEPAPSAAALPGVSLEGVTGEGRSALEELQAAWAQLQQWWPKDQSLELQQRYARLLCAVYRRDGRVGEAGVEMLKLLKTREGGVKKKTVEEWIGVSEQLGWAHWAAHYRECVLFKQFPAKLPPF